MEILLKSLLESEAIKINPKLLKAVEMNQIAYAVSRIILNSDNLLCGESPETKLKIIRIIENCYKNSKPLIFNITLGCYKSPKVFSSTYANWAEVFNLRFMIRVLSQVEMLYPFGVKLEYRLQDILMDKLNCIPQEKVLAYANSFMEVINLFNCKLKSSGLSIGVSRYSEMVALDEFEDEIAKSLCKVNDLWKDPVYENFVAQAVERASRNYNKESASIEEIVESAKFHAAYVSASVRFESADEDRIVLVHRKNLKSDKPFIHFRSCENSSVQFWVGEGLFIRDRGKVFPTILGGNQLNSFRKVEEVKNNQFESQNPNLKVIGIYERL